jgi:hypothetical protein
MNEMPYTDKRGNIYKYGEFFPVELSPFAYNETLLNDQFPSTKEDVEKLGFNWRELDRKVYDTTINADDLPELIEKTEKSITKEIIGCLNCKKAYRVIDSEFDFLKKLGLSLPRYCVDCRFLRRQKFVVPPKFRKGECMCNGESSTNLKYKNTEKHKSHGNNRCHNSFETAYDVDRDIVYCEDCYKKEVY